MGQRFNLPVNGWKGMVCNTTGNLPVKDAKIQFQEEHPQNVLDPAAYSITPSPASSLADGSFTLFGWFTVATPDDPGYFVYLLITYPDGKIARPSFDVQSPQVPFNEPQAVPGKNLRGLMAELGASPTTGLRQLLGPGTFSLRALMGW